MISFRHKTNSKRINIRTNKQLDERMSSWLQKVFNIRNQIIGFKSSDNKYYDVQTFFLLIERFYNTQVDIVEGNDQAQISFTSDNLNSSSFIRPSQPNTSEINQKASSDDDEAIIINDIQSFNKKLVDGKDVNVLFDIHKGCKKQIMDNIGQFSHPVAGQKAYIYILLHNNVNKNNFSIYLGRICVAVMPLTKKYKQIIQNVLSRSKNLQGVQQTKGLRPIEDQAPSFTTYHLQERLNQQACSDYLIRMNREGLLTSYEYHKLIERLEDNFVEFYRIFCEGVIDNDYQSFKNQIRGKVENNLEMLLSNVEQMDLSRPISRQEPRRQHWKKPVPQIEIVKVENYFQVLDTISDRIGENYLGFIKKILLDQNQNQELCGYFARFSSRQIGKQQLSRSLTNYIQNKLDTYRPISRQNPRAERYDRRIDGNMIQNDQERLQQAPMFGLPSGQQMPRQSPTKNLSDIETIYKLASNRLSEFSEDFAPQEYGLLYHYLQTHDDSLLNSVADLYSGGWLDRLRAFLRQKIDTFFCENYSEPEMAYIVSNKPAFQYLFENFKFDSNLQAFKQGLKEELNKVVLLEERRLHKKSSDSKLLTLIKNDQKVPQKRRYSGDQEQEKNQAVGIPSPKASSFSVWQRSNELLAAPWAEQFQEFLGVCKFEKQKQEYLRAQYKQINPSLFLGLRDYLLNKKTNKNSLEYYRNNFQSREYEEKGLMLIFPLFMQLLKEFQKQGKITNRMRQWAAISFIQSQAVVIGAFELYLMQKDQQDLLNTLNLAYDRGSEEMSQYRTYLNRIEQTLKQMVIHDAASLQMFRYHPTLIRAIIQVFYFTGNFEQMMESLDLLQQQHVQNTTINTASLNFSGINTNPFEYDDGSDMFQELNRYVQQLTQAEFPGLTEWKIGKIDKQYTSNQLSVGLNHNLQNDQGKLLNRQIFETIWRSKFDASQVKAKLETSQQQISICIGMDYIFYRAVIRYVYKLSSFQEFDQKIKQLDPKELNSFLQKKFNRPASKLDVKENLVIEYLAKQRIDVMCLQQAGTVDWRQELIPGYGQIKKHDSVILYRKQKLGTPREDLNQKYGQMLDFNKDSVCLFTNRNYLIISAHLKAKKIHIQQAKSMFEALREIKSHHPFIKIIIGIDSNHLIHPQNLIDANGKQIFFLTPRQPQKVTTVKKRSFMQAQFKKAGEEVSQVKDHIVSSHQINYEDTWIESIDGSESQNKLLPNDVHPYDHYVIHAKLRCL